MTCLLTSAPTLCQECGKSLSGGRDTFGTFDCPLCIECKFICDERGYLPVDKEQREEDAKELSELRRTEIFLIHHIVEKEMEGASETFLERLEDELEATREEIEELEEYYDLLPGEEIIL